MLTKEDKAIRKTGIGGSDLAALFGLSNYRKPIDVFLEKTGQLAEVPDEEDTFAQSVGKILESVICKEWQRKHTDLLFAGPWPTCSHPDRSWHTFSLDGLGLLRQDDDALTDQGLPPNSRIDRVIEAKSAGEWASKGYGDEGTDAIPYPHILQTHWYMSALDVDRTDVCAALNTNDYREYVISRDAELEGYLLTEVEKFWVNHVLANKPPPPDGSPQFNEYIRGRFEKTRPELLDSTPYTDALTLDLLDTRQKAKELKEIDEVLSQKLKLAIGDSAGIHTEYGKTTFKFHAQGKVNPWKTMDRLAEIAVERDLLTETEVESIKDELRGEAPRVLRLPTRKA